jgi:hypothetical protein
MTAIEDARSALRYDDMSFQVGEVLRALIADHERVTEENDKLRKQRNTAHARSRRQAESMRLALHSVLEAVKDEPYDPTDIWYSPDAEAFVRAAKTIQAIKQMRDDNPGLSLGDAKRYIDEKRTEWVARR